MSANPGQLHDYVVVGAGSAGCALARRLSDEPDVSVALLEARAVQGQRFDGGQRRQQSRR